jgi:uncharacterized membrane protein
VSLRAAARGLLGLVFIAAGLNHFRNPAFYLAMMPPYLPAPLGLVYLSGVLEVVGGAAVFITRWRAAAGWGLIVLLVAVFPANVEMALHPEQFSGIAPWMLWARLPLQALLIAWAYWATRPDGGARSNSSLS